jgi:hypothetical protein
MNRVFKHAIERKRQRAIERAEGNENSVGESGNGINRVFKHAIERKRQRAERNKNLVGQSGNGSLETVMPIGGKVQKMAHGGKVKKMAKGGKITRGDGCCKQGHTKGKMR